MTLESRVTSQTFLADGVNRVFEFSFKAWEGEMQVIVTAPDEAESDVTESSNILIYAEENGGTVTYPIPEATPPLSSGYKVTVRRDMSFQQQTDLVTAGRYDSAVVEMVFDRLVAQDQQVREELYRAVKVPVASPTTPEELVDELFEARDQAERAAGAASSSAGDSANSAASSEGYANNAASSANAAAGFASAASDAEDMARKWAVNPEDEPVVDSPETKYSALHWARKAGKAAAGDIPPATQTMRGAGRMASRSEAESGETNVASSQNPAFMTPEDIAFYAGANISPKLSTALENASTALDKAQEAIEMAETAGGLPLLSIIYTTTGLSEDGYLDISQDQGLLSRAAYPDAWARIQQMIDAGSPNVVDEATWQAKALANGGYCGDYSTGDGSTTFRPPRLPMEVVGGKPARWESEWFDIASSGAYNFTHGLDIDPANQKVRTLLRFKTAVSGWAVGDVIDTLYNNNEGNVSSVETGWTLGLSNNSILMTNGNNSWITTIAKTGGWASAGILRSHVQAKLIVESKIIPAPTEYTPMLKMYGAVTDAGTANIAALIQATAGKLDTSRYEQDNQSTFIYPNGGTAANPANVTTNSRYVMDSPYPGYFVECVVQVKFNNAWGATGWWTTGGTTNMGLGAKAHLLDQGSAQRIVMQTGSVTIALLTESRLQGNPFDAPLNVGATLPCRIYCKKGGPLP